MEDVIIEADENAFDISNAGDANYKKLKAKGSNKPGSVGFKVSGSPGLSAKDAESEGYETGFDISNSPNANFDGSKAVLPERNNSKKKVHQVKLPKDYKKRK